MIRDSVSVIFSHEQDYFFITRQNYLKSFPGYTAFPGGKIERDEDILGAAQREIIEELGYDFKSSDKVISYRVIGEATSPSFNPKRFRNYYVLVRLKQKPDFDVCSLEASCSFWLSEDNFVTRFSRGELLCVKPMFTILNFLKLKNDDEYQDFRLEGAQGQGILPEVEMLSGVIQYMPLSNTVPPATRTNCFFIGDIIIDPSPKDEQEYEKLKQVVRNLNLSSIIISHHHGDHHQFANNLARDLNLPILISKDSFTRITQKRINYFDNIKIDFLEEGKVITVWKNKNVKAYAIPGHDEGHFGFAPDCMSWFIVGDLFQGIGTVVVGGDEGDMDKYLQSLERVISLSPKCVIPSHGIALGGVHILEKTYKHRIMREKQILEMAIRGKSPDEILDVIYFELPKKLHKYALANINSHLVRLQKYGHLEKV